MENFIAELMPHIIEVIVLALTGIAAYLGAEIKKCYNDKVKSEEKRKVVETTCRYVNQLYYDLDGPSKLLKAKENILLQLQEKGIPITDLEMTVLIESTVNSFKEAVK